MKNEGKESDRKGHISIKLFYLSLFHLHHFILLINNLIKINISRRIVEDRRTIRFGGRAIEFTFW